MSQGYFWKSPFPGHATLSGKVPWAHVHLPSRRNGWALIERGFCQNFLQCQGPEQALKSTTNCLQANRLVVAGAYFQLIQWGERIRPEGQKNTLNLACFVRLELYKYFAQKNIHLNFRLIHESLSNMAALRYVHQKQRACHSSFCKPAFKHNKKNRFLFVNHQFKFVVSRAWISPGVRSLMKFLTGLSG